VAVSLVYSKTHHLGGGRSATDSIDAVESFEERGVSEAPSMPVVKCVSTRPT